MLLSRLMCYPHPEKLTLGMREEEEEKPQSHTQTSVSPRHGREFKHRVCETQDDVGLSTPKEEEKALRSPEFLTV